MTRGLNRLLTELDAWAAEGRTASLWWRDDDAVDATAPLEQLLALSQRHAIPLALAVIPAHATAALRDRLAWADNVTVLQHGYAHVNHAAPGQKKSEYPSARSAGEVRDEIAQGRRRLDGYHNLAPVFVPPWNRFGDELPPLLAEFAFLAVSGFGAPKGTHGVLCLNCHADVTAWRSAREFAGDDVVADSLTRDLMWRRSERRDRGLPTGLLTHHLVHDQRSWAFIDQLFGVTRAHRAVRWITTANALGAIDANPGDGA